MFHITKHSNYKRSYICTADLNLVHMAEEPLQMPISHSRLVLRLHMTSLEGLDPHETALIMLRPEVIPSSFSRAQ